MIRLMELSHAHVSSAFRIQQDPPYSERTRESTSAEWYVVACFAAASSLLSLVDQLELSVRTMARNPRIKISGRPVLRTEALAYGIENYLLRVTAAFDRSLILVNEVLRLGNHHRNCTRQIILKNRIVRGSAACEPLKDLGGLVERYRSDRNKIHRVPYEHDELTFLHSIEFTRDAWQRLELPPMGDDDPPFPLEISLKIFVREMRSDFRETNGKIRESVEELLLALGREFEGVHARLTAQPN